MAKLSATRKLGIAARVAYQQAGRTRFFRSAMNAVRATAAHFGRVLSQLWLEVTGFVFLALAAIGATALVREYIKYHAGKADGSRVAIAVCFTVLFGWFGLSSFWRVRKKG
ncbi:MAG: hypothetical protein LAO03_00845 [Acidobacteriia bacterium]|nr:hypothetical protein [Terriglobia bacterium]